MGIHVVTVKQFSGLHVCRVGLAILGFGPSDRQAGVS
jgi:hypothetical protein